MLVKKLKIYTVLFSLFIAAPLFANGKSDSTPVIPDTLLQKIEENEETTSSWYICKVKDKNTAGDVVAGPLDTKEQALAVFFYLELPEDNKYCIAKNYTFHTKKPSSYYKEDSENVKANLQSLGALNALYAYFGMEAPQENSEATVDSILDESGIAQTAAGSVSPSSQTEKADEKEEVIDETKIFNAQNNVVLIETISQEELLKQKQQAEEEKRLAEEKKQAEEEKKKKNNQTYTLIESDTPYQVPVVPAKTGNNYIPPEPQQQQSFSLPITTDESASIARYQQEYLHDYETFGLPELPGEETSVPQEFVENPNEADQFGRTYLMKAAKSGNNWQIKTLLASGADVNLCDKDGWTALMYASRYQENTDIIETLLNAGAEVRAINNYELSSLTLACSYNNNPDIINKLLSYYSISEKEVMNAFIMLITNNIADEYVQLAKIKLFLAKSIPLNTYFNGKTPLMYAAQFSNSTKLIQLLLDNDANISIRSSEGKTAFEYASKNKNLVHDETYWKLNKIMNKN